MADLYVKQSDLDVIADKLRNYQKAIEQIEQSIEEFKRVLEEGEGEAMDALKEITEKQGNVNLEEYKQRVSQLSNTFLEYNDDFFTSQVRPISRGSFTELDRNDIWGNLMSIEWAEGDIQNGIHQASTMFCDDGKNKRTVDEAVAETNRFMTRIKNLRGELWNQFKRIEQIDDTDKSYQNRIKNELGQFASFWDNLTAAFEQVGNFLMGVKDAVVGLVTGLISLVEGLVCVILNIAGLGAGMLYGAITGDWRLKDMCSDNLGKTFKTVETIMNDPWLLVEGVGQQYNDGVNEKGLAYGAGMLVGDFLPELIGVGAVSAVGKLKYMKVITALEKIGVVVDVEKVIAKFGSQSKFLKYIDEFGGEVKFTELVKEAGGIDELTRLVDEAGGTKEFLEAVEEAGGVERYLDNLHPISENAKPHLIDPEGIVNKKVSGGHNQEKFIQFAEENKIKIASERNHPSIPGVKEIEYQMPKLDRAGNVVDPIEYKGKLHKKTVYDPSLISDDMMYQWGQEAMRSGTKEGKKITGYAKNGLRFRGYLDESGNIKNFYPMIENN